ncbi:MAG: SPOR domain-containing protein [Candidatus Omnitrophica bacterium]|nr:SPOR domain-containing protein [Candidatus Omnitrophota bacterium]
MSQERETQLEWFDLPHHASPRRGARILAQPLRMRPDHAVLGLILLLIGTSVVFAVGMERGKHLARTGPGVFEPPAAASQRQASAAVPGETLATRPPAPGKGSAATSPTPNTVPKQPSPKPGKTIVPKSRFAVQVVSYRQLKLAQRELQRLQQRGEEAFLVSGQDRTVLLVGPFVNKERASAKLASLRRLYQDCFVRAL